MPHNEAPVTGSHSYMGCSDLLGSDRPDAHAGWRTATSAVSCTHTLVRSHQQCFFYFLLLSYTVPFLTPTLPFTAVPTSPHHLPQFAFTCVKTRNGIQKNKRAHPSHERMCTRGCKVTDISTIHTCSCSVECFTTCSKTH